MLQPPNCLFLLFTVQHFSECDWPLTNVGLSPYTQDWMRLGQGQEHKIQNRHLPTACAPLVPHTISVLVAQAHKLETSPDNITHGSSHSGM
jgi:hypothetical protein